MRWQFPKYLSPAEVTQRDQSIALMDDWWRAFGEHRQEIGRVFSRESQMDLVQFMADHLQAVDQRLCWEFGPAVDGDGHRLVITPEAERQLRPLVNTLLERAPAFDGWEFHGYRVPESLEMAGPTVEARVGGGIEGVVVRVQGAEDGAIDLTYLAPDTTGPDDGRARNVAFILTETLVGEEDLDRWIRYIDVGKLKAKGLLAKGTDMTGVVPLDRLRPTVQAVIGSWRDQQPDQPMFRRIADPETAAWSNLTMEPAERDDYPGRSDQYTAITMSLDVWGPAYQDKQFDSSRHSKAGELFGYLKTDGTDGFEGMPWEDRAELEEAIDAALRQAEAGCVFGGGTGRIYSYVDLALADAERGIDVIRETLRAGHIHHRTWILFSDAALSDEWVGVYDDTPPPPRSDD